MDKDLFKIARDFISEGLGNLPGVNAPKVRQEEPATPRCGASVPRLRIERWH
jgi:hypothetical protein